MNYKQAEEYIRKKRGGGVSLGLSRMRELCRRLDNPEKKLRFIHIAGTNGKGSVAAYISSILGISGYLTGRYVSPAVFSYEEIIRFQDSKGCRNIDKEFLAELITEVALEAKNMEKDGWEEPTAFEMETAAAFLAFCRKKCQVVVLEVGLGGREDATNVIENVLASVITPVGRDHTSFLGDTLEEIAREKAGIIREKVPVITFQNDDAALQIIREVCKEKNAPLISVCRDDIKPVQTDVEKSIFAYKGENYVIRMPAPCQIFNAALALETCSALENVLGLDEEDRTLGLRETYWRGRFEILHRDPFIVADGAHNEDGARALKEALDLYFPGKNIHGIMGVFSDKEYEKMVSILQPRITDIITLRAPSERGLSAEELRRTWEKAGCRQTVAAENMNEALKKSLSVCAKDDIIVIFGSLSLLPLLTWK